MLYSVQMLGNNCYLKIEGYACDSYMHLYYYFCLPYSFNYLINNNNSTLKNLVPVLQVDRYWAEKGISGFTVYKFRLRRVEGQPTLTTNQV